jgi:hypothetical protein
LPLTVGYARDLALEPKEFRAWVVLPELRHLGWPPVRDNLSAFELPTLARGLPPFSPCPGGLKPTPAWPHRLPSRAWPAGLQPHTAVAYVAALAKRQEVRFCATCLQEQGGPESPLPETPRPACGTARERLRRAPRPRENACHSEEANSTPGCHSASSRRPVVHLEGAGPRHLLEVISCKRGGWKCSCRREC